MLPAASIYESAPLYKARLFLLDQKFDERFQLAT